MRDINFLNNTEFCRKNSSFDKSYEKFKTIAKVLIGVIAIGYGLLYALEWVATIRIKMITVEMKQYSKVIELNENINKYNTRMNDISKIIEKANSKGVMNSDILKAIGEVMPDKVVLLNYTTGENSKKSIEGKASDTGSISHFIYGLKNSEFFHDVQLKTVNENKNGKTSEYTFLIELK